MSSKSEVSMDIGSFCFPHCSSLTAYLFTGKKTIARDLHNLKKDLRGQDEATELMNEIQKCQEKFHAKVIPVTDENEELQILFIQTAHMRQAFRSFPEVLLLDATYRTNKLRMPLFVFVIQDGTGSSQVVAYVFVACEQLHVVSRHTLRW
ncbi:hypothetical protein HPB48_009303 [Haemaphysalis longicornis]|uniref:ZSWIM1/3 RNaseH-like domain-containing protein n=1 Tax=Haemaphysalis longicornis TaxID=44386 RepID=A0A9J6GEI0_HAELO|nr:hypothetical protein HPB48_009303 [Haemaphysalis longicornis]